MQSGTVIGATAALGLAVLSGTSVRADTRINSEQAGTVILRVLSGEAMAAESGAVRDRQDVPPLDLRPFAVKPLGPADLPPSNVFAAPSPSQRINFRSGGTAPAIREDYRAVVVREAASSGIPSELVDAVISVESGYNAAAVGVDGEIGLMQVLPATARMLGFTGSLAELAAPATNIHYGVLYLAAAWRLARQDVCTATMKYRAGHGETRFSYLSVDYCVRVRARLIARGVPVTGSVPQATFGQQTAGRRGRLTSYGSLGANLQSLNVQFRELTAKVAVRTFR